MKKILLFMLGVILALPVFARDFTYEYKGQTLTYTVIDEDARTCQTKSGKSLSSAGNKVSGDLEIPSKVTDGNAVYTVTAIGHYAFSNCRSLTSISIPESVTSIGNSAFDDCRGLTYAEFASIESLCGIFFYHNGDSNPLYYAHKLYIEGKEVTSINIPDGITRIGENTFLGCSGLTSITLPESVTSIGFYAFGFCSSLTSITLPESVTSIGEYAFDGCSSLTYAEFASIESLCGIKFENYASNPLYYAHKLYIDGKEVTSINIPDGVTSIGRSAFSGCSSLQSITLPESVTSIGGSAFSGCSSLTSIIIPDGITKIDSDTFSGCSSLQSISIPENVASIDGRAFSGCSSLTSIIIPDGITKIDSDTFYGCSSLQSISIPENVASIDGRAFYGCSSLRSISIPENVTSIGYSAFQGCSSLRSITIPNGVTSIGSSAFSGCDALTAVCYFADMLVEGNANIFSSSTYENATLYMSEDGVILSRFRDPWKNFKKVEQSDPAGIDDITADFDENAPYEIYNLNGVKVGDSVEALSSGIYIIRQGATTKKIAVK